jgi:hypothetical protein
VAIGVHQDGSIELSLKLSVNDGAQETETHAVSDSIANKLKKRDLVNLISFDCLMLLLRQIILTFFAFGVYARAYERPARMQGTPLREKYLMLLASNLT